MKFFRLPSKVPVPDPILPCPSILPDVTGSPAFLFLPLSLAGDFAPALALVLLCIPGATAEPGGTILVGQALIMPKCNEKEADGTTAWFRLRSPLLQGSLDRGILFPFLLTP